MLDINNVIDALAQDQLVHVLAEPNITAMSGEQASFLVGGEFPIPVAAFNDTVSIEFKQYGVSLAFVPTVLDSGRISLHVRPEVSQLTDQGAVQLQARATTRSRSRRCRCAAPIRRWSWAAGRASRSPG